MFLLQADKSRLTLCPSSREPITSGSANVYRCRFEFSEDWEGMAKAACFRSGSQTVSVLLDESGECVIPWEVLTTPARQLSAGVYGTRGGDTVLPTIWTDLGVIQPGVYCCWNGSRPPTPGLGEQILSQLENKQDKLSGLPGQVVGFDESGNAVPVDMPSGGGGEDGGAAYEFGHGLKQEGRTVSVDAVDDFTGDNTLPMTAAGVQTVVGNIDVLLGTI